MGCLILYVFLYVWRKIFCPHRLIRFFFLFFVLVSTNQEMFVSAVRAALPTAARSPSAVMAASAANSGAAATVVGGLRRTQFTLGLIFVCMVSFFFCVFGEQPAVRLLLAGLASPPGGLASPPGLVLWLGLPVWLM